MMLNFLKDKKDKKREDDERLNKIKDLENEIKQIN